MIVGEVVIDIKDLEKAMGSKESIKEFSNSLIPLDFRHIEAVKNNQLYVVAMAIRKTTKYDIRNTTQLVNELTDGLKIYGIINELITIRELLSVVNYRKVLKYIKVLIKEEGGKK